MVVDLDVGQMQFPSLLEMTSIPSDASSAFKDSVASLKSDVDLWHLEMSVSVCAVCLPVYLSVCFE